MLISSKNGEDIVKERRKGKKISAINGNLIRINISLKVKPYRIHNEKHINALSNPSPEMILGLNQS